MTVVTYNTRFCPTWAEAHERSLASLNHGRPPYPVKWKGCIVLTRGTCVDVVEQQEQSTEIVVGGKHWVTDEMPAVIAGRACPTTSSAKKERRSRAYLWRPALGSLGRNDQRRRIAYCVGRTP
jgi:hypothetical protein